MKLKIKTAAVKGAPPSPVSHRPWQESVDEFDLHLQDIVDQESDEEVVDLWLEDPQSFMEGLEAPTAARERFTTVIRRVKTGGSGLRNYATAKLASSGWDQELVDAKAHVDQVLKELGNK